MASVHNNIKKLFIVISIILLGLILYSVNTIIDEGNSAKAFKEDYAELHSVQYGLFNSTIWAEKIAHIIDQKIDEFDFTENSRAEIKQYVETILDTLIVEADKAVREKNKSSRGFFNGLLGSTKQIITDSLIDIKDLRNKVPEFTDAILNELERPESQKVLKTMMREKLHQLTKDNLAHTDLTLYDAILKKYDATTYKECDATLDKHMQANKERLDALMIRILLLALALIIFVILQGSILSSISLLLLSITSIALLVPGIMLPMLDIEAKISKLYFTILEKPLTFENQILFFQSKSISNLVSLLLESGEARMILVGVLLVTFSIIFPTIKVISTYMYFYIHNVVGNNPVTRFFALKSTKWSMADVMVVSIFMAYLGLDGVVSKELEKIEERSQPINVITTNGTHLEVGFYLFLGFVVTSFVLSMLVEKTREKS